MDQICYLNNNACFSKHFPWLQIKQRWQFILLTFIVFYSIGSIIIYFTSSWYNYSPNIVQKRMCSISYVSGILCLVTLIYDTEFLRALVLVLLPLFAQFVIVIATFQTKDLVVAIIGHVLHFITICYVLYCRKIPHPTLILMAGGIWMIHVTFVTNVIDGMVMIYYFDMAVTNISIAISTVIMMAFSFAVHKYVPNHDNAKVDFSM